MTINELPKHLQDALENKDVKFIGKTDRIGDRGINIFLIFFFLWLCSFLGFGIALLILWPLKLGEAVGSFAFVVVCMFLLFVRILLYFLKTTFSSTEFYFVLTDKELITYNESVLEIIDWQVFRKKISVKRKKKYSNITLFLRSGTYQGGSGGGATYVSESIRLNRVKDGDKVLDLAKTLIEKGLEN